jgi:two-component system OmpR family sensor kinase
MTMKRWRDLSLRLRLTLLYVALLAILLGSLGIALYLDTQQFLISNTAARMRGQVAPTLDRLSTLGGPGGPGGIAGPGGRPGAFGTQLAPRASELAIALTARETVAVIIGADGITLASGAVAGSTPPAPTPDSAQVAAALAGATDITYATIVDGRRQLVVLVPLRLGGAKAKVDGVAQLSTPLDLADAILFRQRLLTSAGVVLALVAGTLGIAWLTGSTLAPLQAMVVTCRRIAAGDFSWRVRLPPQRDEIGQLAVAFDEMAERIDDTFAAQNRFVADAAHELRTPLTALRGSLEVLLRGSQDDPAAANLLLQGMYHDVTRLGRLTEQLLDLTRLDAPLAVQRHDLELAPFLVDTLAQVRRLAEGRTVTLDPGPPLTLSADPDLLQRALYNLIVNAVQHTDASGIIRVGWTEVARPDGPAVALVVSDNGEGIAPADQEHLFEPFYRGERSRSRRRGGTGLGLAIVRAIAEAHGGGIAVRSEPGAGSTFTLTLPRAVASERPRAGKVA